jgi:hypothetical protein
MQPGWLRWPVMIAIAGAEGHYIGRVVTPFCCFAVAKASQRVSVNQKSFCRVFTTELTAVSSLGVPCGLFP